MNLLGGWRRRSGEVEPSRETLPRATAEAASSSTAEEDEDLWQADVEQKVMPISCARGGTSSTSSAGHAVRKQPLLATAVRPNAGQSLHGLLVRPSLGEEERRRAREAARRRAEEEERRRELERQQEALRREEERRREAAAAVQREQEELRRREEAARAKAQLAENDLFSVQLPMYDLSNGLAKFVPAALLNGYKFQGVWHTGVRVFGKEIWFGGCVLESDFDESPFGIPEKIIRFGKTSRTYDDLIEFIHDELALVYNVRTYDVLGRNCNHFSNEIVKFLLGGKQIPDEVLMQPQWAQSGALVQLLRPALNAWLGGFGGELQTSPSVVHMTRAEKEREQRRLELQWAEWVQERRKERAVQEAEQRREAEQEEFQTWMLEQHQRMQQQESEEEERKREEAIKLEEAARQQRQQEAEQTLRDVLASADVVDAAVIEWAVAEAKGAGVEAKAPFLLRDAEHALRRKAQQ